MQIPTGTDGDYLTESSPSRFTTADGLAVDAWKRPRATQDVDESPHAGPANPHVGRGNGVNIRDVREELGMTQLQFAREVGVSLRTVNRWENGWYRPSRLARERLASMVAKLGGPVSDQSILGVAS